MHSTKDTRQLNWFSAWAVVFCDIGTLVYYVPDILYGHVKDATPFFVLLTTDGFILLSLKYIGIRKSATASLVMAGSAFLVDLIVIGSAFWNMNAGQWRTILDHLSMGKDITSYELLVGFAAAWLAFSGLESISQLSPTMRLPLRRTTRYAMAAVMIMMVITSPILAVLSVGLLPGEVKAAQSERFISELGLIVGGLGIKLAVVLTASSLLLFASNTAINGSYHLFLALSRQGFLPKIMELRNRAFNTPHIAIVIATVVPALLILLPQGQMAILGDMYAFGLLGAFVFSSLSPCCAATCSKV